MNEMKLNQTKHLKSDTEVIKIFEFLDLMTQEQRNKFLSLIPLSKPNQLSETYYVTRLSNNSELFSTKGRE